MCSPLASSVYAHLPELHGCPRQSLKHWPQWSESVSKSKTQSSPQIDEGSQLPPDPPDPPLAPEPPPPAVDELPAPDPVPPLPPPPSPEVDAERFSPVRSSMPRTRLHAPRPSTNATAAHFESIAWRIRTSP